MLLGSLFSEHICTVCCTHDVWLLPNYMLSDMSNTHTHTHTLDYWATYTKWYNCLHTAKVYYIHINFTSCYGNMVDSYVHTSIHPLASGVVLGGFLGFPETPFE